MKERNAKIIGTTLGIEDHGIMTATITLDYGGSCQGFGGYCLDEPVKDKRGRHTGRRGTAYGCEFIRRTLEVVGVESWEHLKGKHVRVRVEDHYNGLILAIGNIVEDNWFSPKELAKSMGLRD